MTQDPLSIEQPLFARARLDSQRSCIVAGDREYSYAWVAGAARACADRLREVGVVPGDRVTVYLDKCVEAVVAFYGAWLAGAIVVPAHHDLRNQQLDHVLRNSGTKVLISRADLLSENPGALTTVAFIEVDPEASSEAWREPAPSHGQPGAAILYTSGSTGMPKGILVSHANLIAGSRIVSRYLELGPSERILSVLPFSFDYGLNQLLTCVWNGATLVLQRSLFPADICRSLKQHEITGLAGVPPLWIQLMQPHSPFAQATFPALRYITNSGGTFPVELVERYRAVLPHTRIFLMYGLSEAFRSTYLPPEELDRRRASIGKAIPETEILVLDEAGRECGPDEPGILVHRGPTVALGYWNDPDATAEVFRPDPFGGEAPKEKVVFSGDVVRKDADGFIYFIGRRDQCFKSSGFRISPEEVEAVLMRSGLVAECIAHGVPHAEAGAVVCVHVVARSAEVSDSQVLAYCRREMPRYMVPAAIHRHTSLPRANTGKHDRKRIGSHAVP